jgi:CRP-like cAMP-binding protein
MKERVFAKNDVLFREGDMGDSLFQILEGKVGVYLKYSEPGERKLTEMLPGQYFGELAVINAWPRSSTVVAEEDLKVLEVSEGELNEFFERDPDKILDIMKQIGLRIRELTADYNEVNAFLKEKEDEEARKSSGFLAKVKKYAELHEQYKKNEQWLSAEDTIKQQNFSRPLNSPIPIEEYDAGTIIFRQGENGNYMYAVQGGSVGIYINYGENAEKKLTGLYTGSFFGEMSLLDLEPRSATAVAEEDGTVLEIIRPEDMKELFKVNPMEINMILEHLSNRLRMLTKDYARACEAAAKE